MISIAIIEDDNVTRETLKSIIQTTDGFECAGTFADAESGLEFLTGNPADIVSADRAVSAISKSFQRFILGQYGFMMDD